MLRSLYVEIVILDSNGTQVVKYVYDAWGNHTVSGSNTTLGNLNPFRYRSYFYDTETKLYYLKTRYYDPSIGRFLNMDSVQYADPETIGGLNLYAYCGNNPVNNIDPEGNIVIGLIVAIGILIAGTAAGGAAKGVKSYKEGKRGWALFGDIVLGASIGLAVSGAALALTGVAIGVLGGGATATILGLSAKSIFSIGALAFDFTAFIIAPIYGFTMEAIEYEQPEPVPLFKKPQPTPPHPYNKKNYKRGIEKLNKYL